MTFTKLFSSITESTVWCEPAGTRLVWITMLAKADQHGRIYAAVPGLANLARVSIEECVNAINTFLAPDEWSRTPDNDGRRIEVIDGGWRLLNHAKYRELRDEESRREQNRAAKARQREREKSAESVIGSDDSQPASAQHPARSAQAEAEAEADISRAKDSAQPAASRFVDFWEAYPHKRGKKPAQAKWKAKNLDRIADALIADVRKRIASDERWLRGVIPDPLTYLNQERWDDEFAAASTQQQPSKPRKPAGPSETPLERDIAYARQQFALTGDATERDRRFTAATTKHRENAQC